MARIRTIKPEFWTDEKVVDLSAFARLLFIGIWNFCDDEGRMVFSPKRIKMQIFPADALEVTPLFDELCAAGLVEVYSMHEASYLQVCGFNKHQKIDKRSASKIPPPISPTLSVMSPTPSESLRITPVEGNGGDRKGRDAEANASGADAPVMAKDELWAAGKSLLQQAGLPAKQCGSVVGKLAKEYGSEVAVEAVRAAVLERPADPVAYLKATCQGLAGERAGGIAWYATEEGAIRKGQSLGVSPHPGESMTAFKVRIDSAETKARRSQMLKASLRKS